MLSRTSHRWKDFYWIDSTTLSLGLNGCLQYLQSQTSINTWKHTKYEGTCSICLRVKSHLQIFPGRMFKDDGEIFPWVVSLPPSRKKYCPEGNVFISADSVPAHLLWLFVPLFHLWYLPSGCQAPQQLSRHIIQSHLYRGVVLRKPEVRKKQALNSYFVKGRGTTADSLMACSFPHSHCCSGVVYATRRYTSYTRFFSPTVYNHLMHEHTVRNTLFCDSFH